MNVIFRVDASIQIGSGHVMRCLTLADTLKKEGVSCVFICREHKGNMLAFIHSKGHKAIALPFKKSSSNLTHQHSRQARQEYIDWLGVSIDEDVQQTIEAIQSFTTDKPDWLIIDHYALDTVWEKSLRPYCQKIMVIDDLADRQHDCDLLLDQTFGRDESDYQALVPDDCTILTGSYYALLRPEFAQWREYSLQRRQKPQLKQLLITLGGVDKDNVTGQVLAALANSYLPKDCKIIVVMGEHAPWLESIKSQASHLPWTTEVRVNVANMAELMANSDLCIGAAGSTTWERCCLGLPSIILVTANNQMFAAKLLKEKIEIIKHIIDIRKRLLNFLSYKSYLDKRLRYLSEECSKITNGSGTNTLITYLYSRTRGKSAL